MNKKYLTFIDVANTLHELTKINICIYKNEKIFFANCTYVLPDFLIKSDNDLKTFDISSVKDSKKKYLHYKNEQQLEYLAAPFKSVDEEIFTLSVGPFLSDSFSTDRVLVNNKYTLSERSELENFFQILPNLTNSEINSIEATLVNFTQNDFISHKKKYEYPEIPSQTVVQLNNSKREKMLIEERYRKQDLMMKRIKNGDYDRVKMVALGSSEEFKVFNDRVIGNPLRSAKNIAIVYNTTCRIAAELGDVHPLFLHEISEKYALLIERTNTLNDLKCLIEKMPSEYALVVKNLSYPHESPITRKSVHYIQINLGHQISLKDIASYVSVSPAYLSRKFKADIGCTITKYINYHRIKEAKIYLEMEETSVTDIAYIVGFSDLNYFIKTFKNITGFTPKQYQKDYTTFSKNNIY